MSSDTSIPVLVSSLHQLGDYSIEPLRSLYRGTTLDNSGRVRVALALLESDRHVARDLGRSLLKSDPGELRVICDHLRRYAVQADVISRPAPVAPEGTESELDAFARQQANWVVSTARLGKTDVLWSHLRAGVDNSVRSYIIDRWSKCGGSSELLIDRLSSQQISVDEARALVLILGSFSNKDLAENRRDAIIRRLDLTRQFEAAPDAGLHAAYRWLLMRWGRSVDVKEAEAKLGAHSRMRHPDCRWFTDSIGNTMLVLGPAEFLMGSRNSEVVLWENPEPLHPRRIDHQFAIAMLETTVGQFSTMMGKRGPNSANDGNDENPVNAVSWFEAAKYCNVLSEREGIPKAEWCYVDDERSTQLREVEKAWQRRGYRLPTEAEWEFACRAGTITPRFFGYSDTLLPQYAWCLTNSPDGSQHPVGRTKPNDFGLFDVYGNTIEWCHDWFQKYPGDRSTNDVPAVKVLRGSAVGDPTGFRSALRDLGPPEFSGGLANGFRVCRTIIPSTELTKQSTGIQD